MSRTRYKLARHALDRLRERTGLPDETIAQLDAAVADLQVPPGRYYLPLDQGHAAFKTVGPNHKLVLSTILAPGMQPQGSSLSHVVPRPKVATTDPLATLSQLIERHGVLAEGDHKRILVPKDLLPETRLVDELGFRPSRWAVPEIGENRRESYRHPRSKLHLHSHPGQWVVHEDRHPMGFTHAVTEGLPALVKHYVSNLQNAPSLADRVEALMPPKQHTAVQTQLQAAFTPPTGEKMSSTDYAHTLRTLSKLIDRYGVEAGTGHKRITIPKELLSEPQLLKGLGFVPVSVAIPESGEDQKKSYRHRDNNLHLHSHPDRWTIHEDRHPAATMRLRAEMRPTEKGRMLLAGAPHVITEGVPGLAQYLKGRITKAPPLADRVDELMDPTQRAQLHRALRSSFKPYAELHKEALEAEEYQKYVLPGAAAAAGLAPTAIARIGERPLQHQDKGEVFNSLRELQKKMQPGDIVLSGEHIATPSFRGGAESRKKWMRLLTGIGTRAPEGYHTSIVGDGGRIIDSAPGTGTDTHTGALLYGDRIQVLRPKLTDAQRKLFVLNAHSAVNQADGVELGVRNALERSALSKKEPDFARDVATKVREALYNGPQGRKAGVREVFGPKMESATRLAAGQQAQQAAHDAIDVQTTARGLADAAIRYYEQTGKVPRARDIRGWKELPKTMQHMCSSLPASLLPPGVRISDNKRPENILSGDYLRSNLLEPIGRIQGEPLSRPERAARYAPHAARLGAGALLAGGVYGTGRLVQHLSNTAKQRPATPQRDVNSE